MTLYTPAADGLLHGTLGDLEALDLRAVLVDLADYTFSAAHSTLADIPAGARVATSGAIANLSILGGKLLADDTVIDPVTGDTAEGVAVYIHDAIEAGTVLLDFKSKRSDGTTDIAFTPNGGAVTLDWHDTNGILRLVT